MNRNSPIDYDGNGVDYTTGNENVSSDNLVCGNIDLLLDLTSFRKWYRLSKNNDYDIKLFVENIALFEKTNDGRFLKSDFTCCDDETTNVLQLDIRPFIKRFFLRGGKNFELLIDTKQHDMCSDSTDSPLVEDNVTTVLSRETIKNEDIDYNCLANSEAIKMFTNSLKDNFANNVFFVINTVSHRKNVNLSENGDNRYVISVKQIDLAKKKDDVGKSCVKRLSVEDSLMKDVSDIFICFSIQAFTQKLYLKKGRKYDLLINLKSFETIFDKFVTYNSFRQLFCKNKKLKHLEKRHLEESKEAFNLGNLENEETIEVIKEEEEYDELEEQNGKRDEENEEEEQIKNQPSIRYSFDEYFSETIDLLIKEKTMAEIGELKEKKKRIQIEHFLKLCESDKLKSESLRLQLENRVRKIYNENLVLSDENLELTKELVENRLVLRKLSRELDNEHHDMEKIREISRKNLAKFIYLYKKYNNLKELLVNLGIKYKKAEEKRLLTENKLSSIEKELLKTKKMCHFWKSYKINDFKN